MMRSNSLIKAKSLSVTFFLLFVGFVVFSQSVERLNWEVRENDSQLELSFAGGLNTPQISPIDLDGDSFQDLFIFDRTGDVLLPMRFTGDAGDSNYELYYNHNYEFPPLRLWALVRDFNSDGIADIFCAAIPLGVPGVLVYRGYLEDGKIKFELIPDKGKDYLQIDAGGGGFTNLYVAWGDLPAIVDVDSDGDLDILTFEPGGKFISYFQNISVESGWGKDSLKFELTDVCWGKVLENDLNEELFLSDDPNTCSEGNLLDPILEVRHSGSTLVTFDQDHDGDLELLVGDISARGLVFLENGGTPDDAWMISQDVQFPSYNVPIDLPFFPSGFMIDVNQDGSMDLLSSINSQSFAEDEKVLWYFENENNQAEELFQLKKRDFLQDQMLEFGSESKPAIADVNGDGLLDMVIGGYRSDQGSQSRIPSLHLLLNIGSTDAPMFELIDDDYLGMSQFANLLLWSYAPTFGDLDGDGDEDLLVGEYNGKLFFLENTSAINLPMSFAEPIYSYKDIDVGGYSVPDIFDLNGDGMNDIIIGERNVNFDNGGACGSLTYFQNIGSPNNAEFDGNSKNNPNTECLGRVLLNDIPGLPVSAAPEFVQTNVGIRLFVGTDNGEIRLYDGIEDNIYGTFNKIDEKFGDIDVGFKTVVAVKDFTGDGQFEMIIGNVRGGLNVFGTQLRLASTLVTRPVKDDFSARIVPNPWQGSFQLSVESDEKQAGELSTYDARGVLVDRQQVLSGSQIEIGELASGLYFYTFEIDGKWGRGRFVKL